MIRLKDIALRAGVSVMTVSKVLRDAPDISSATKIRIRAMAQEMGYVPDALAQGLRTRATRLIGLVLPASTNPVFARLVLAVEERLHELGYDVIMAHTLNAPEREEKVIRRLISRRIEGLLIFPVYRLSTTAAIYEELLRCRIPTVILGPTSPFCSAFASVQVDDTRASMDVTRHLLQLGHRRIAFLTGPSAAPWAQERFEGYRQALRDANLEVDDRLVYVAGATIEEGTKAALQMLDEQVDATAVQAVNDLVAIGAASTFLDQGVRIPEDLSVVGFGNVLTSTYFRVPLTTVRQPKFRMGAAAVDSLLGLMRGGPVENRRLPADLLIRSSTAPPRAGRTALGRPVTKADS
jgi:DNA-binding LacI/PurR family transcriptional regulator